jgi:hypothetical protein
MKEPSKYKKRFIVQNELNHEFNQFDILCALWLGLLLFYTEKLT